MSDVPELTRLVLDKIEVLGEEGARAYFEVSAGTISAWRNGKNPPSLAAAQRVFDEQLKYNAPEAIIAAAERPSLVLCLPQYESVEPLHFFSVFRCCKLYGIEKIAMIPKIRTLVDEARNDLAEKLDLASITIQQAKKLTKTELAKNYSLAKREIDILKKFITRKPIATDILYGLLENNNFTCCVCKGTKSDSFIVHHIKQYSKSKDNSYKNLAVLCLNDHDLAHKEGLLLHIS